MSRPPVRRDPVPGPEVSLVLAFDASCARCRSVAAVVARTCPELEILPLGDYRVRAWRAEAWAGRAGDPPQAPTLLAVEHHGDADVVRAWHGARLGPPLVVRLGARRAWALVRALRAARLVGPGSG